MNLLLTSLLLLAQAAAPPPPPVSQNGSPATPAPVVLPGPDPASAQFLGDTGLMLVAIKPPAVADYELVIRTLQDALAKEQDPVKVSAAKGWRVFKTTETDAKGNQLYIHVMLPAIPLFDYRPSLLLDELVKDLAPELLSKYQEAFAIPPTRLNLTEFANMSVAPLPLPDPTAPVPVPVPPVKKPGGR